MGKSAEAFGGGPFEDRKAKARSAMELGAKAALMTLMGTSTVELMKESRTLVMDPDDFLVAAVAIFTNVCFHLDDALPGVECDGAIELLNTRNYIVDSDIVNKELDS